MEPSFLALQSFGPLVLCTAEFWSNATFAPQTLEDIVSVAKITTKVKSKYDIKFFSKVIFVNQRHFRDHLEGIFVEEHNL